MRIAPVWIKDKWRSTLDWLTSPPGGPRPGRPLEAPPEPKRPDQPPRSGPRPGGGRRPVSEEPKPGSVDDVGKKLEALQALEQALEAERAAQAKRLAALSECESVARAPVGPLPAEGLQEDLDALKKEFEELQDRLRERIGAQLADMDDFMKKYDELWADAMDHLDDYLANLHTIGEPLAQLWAARKDMQTALDRAFYGDMALMAASVLLPELLALRAAAGEQALGQLSTRIAQAEARAASGARAGARARGARAATTGTTEATRAAELAASRAQFENARVVHDKELLKRVMQKDVQNGLAGGDAGRRQLLAFGDDTETYEIVRKGLFKQAGDKWTVAIHGEPGGKGFGIYTKVGEEMSYVPLTPEQLAQMLRAAGYKEGPVRLISCSAGGGGPQSAARELAKTLEAEVQASTVKLEVSESGHVVFKGSSGAATVTFDRNGRLMLGPRGNPP